MRHKPRVLTSGTGLKSAILALLTIILVASPAGAEKIEEWAVGEGRVPIINITPEFARQKAFNLARSRAIKSVVREIIAIDALETSETGGEFHDYFRQKMSSRAYGQIIQEDTLIAEMAKVPKAGAESYYEYHAKIKAFVVVDKHSGRSPYRVKVELNRHNYEAGDEMVIEVSMDKDCYIHIFNITAENKVLILYPLREEDIALTKRGTFEYPQDESKMHVYPLPGQPQNAEFVRVVATKEPLTFSPADIDSVSGGAGYIDLAATDLITLEMEIISIPFKERAEDVAEYTVSQKKGWHEED